MSKADYGDGLVELYGLTQGALAPGWTATSVPQHTVRLGQGKAVRCWAQGDYKGASKGTSASDATADIHILVDGESWWQAVPVPSGGAASTMTAKNALMVRCEYYALRAASMLSSCACVCVSVSVSVCVCVCVCVRVCVCVCVQLLRVCVPSGKFAEVRWSALQVELTHHNKTALLGVPRTGKYLTMSGGTGANTYSAAAHGASERGTYAEGASGQAVSAHAASAHAHSASERSVYEQGAYAQAVSAQGASAHAHSASVQSASGAMITTTTTTTTTTTRKGDSVPVNVRAASSTPDDAGRYGAAAAGVAGAGYALSHQQHGAADSEMRSEEFGYGGGTSAGLATPETGIANPALQSPSTGMHTGHAGAIRGASEYQGDVGVPGIFGMSGQVAGGDNVGDGHGGALSLEPPHGSFRAPDGSLSSVGFENEPVTAHAVVPTAQQGGGGASAEGGKHSGGMLAGIGAGLGGAAAAVGLGGRQRSEERSERREQTLRTEGSAGYTRQEMRTEGSTGYAGGSADYASGDAKGASGGGFLGKFKEVMGGTQDGFGMYGKEGDAAADAPHVGGGVSHGAGASADARDPTPGASGIPTAAAVKTPAGAAGVLPSTTLNASGDAGDVRAPTLDATGAWDAQSGQYLGGTQVPTLHAAGGTGFTSVDASGAQTSSHAISLDTQAPTLGSGQADVSTGAAPTGAGYDAEASSATYDASAQGAKGGKRKGGGFLGRIFGGGRSSEHETDSDMQTASVEQTTADVSTGANVAVASARVRASA